MYAGDSLVISLVASDSTASRKIALLYTFVGVNRRSPMMTVSTRMARPSFSGP